MQRKWITKKEAQVFWPDNKGEPKAMNATVGVKFAQRKVILDPWYIFGGSKWSRTKFRLKHPWVYSKRGLRALYRKATRIFVRDEITPCRIKIDAIYDAICEK